MLRKSTPIIAGMLLVMSSGLAQADHDRRSTHLRGDVHVEHNNRRGDRRHDYHDDHYDRRHDRRHNRARVLHVEPIYARRGQRRQECYYEDVGYKRPHRDRRIAGALIGATLGGVIGNQASHGQHRAPATGVGVAIGAVVGHELARHKHRGRHEQRRVCHYVYDKPRIRAYRVTYRYKGHRYHTRMRHYPGKFIRVDRHGNYRRH